MEEVRQLITMVGALAGLISGAVSGIVALVGMWFALKYQLRSHGDRIERVEKTISNGNGLVQQVQNLQQSAVTAQKFDQVLFSGPDNLNGQVRRVHERIVMLEARCQAEHERKGMCGGFDVQGSETG